jgi:hypothetical protein
MDNVIIGAATIANIVPQGEHALQIKYAQKLLNKCLEQQQARRDSLGRVYSR